MYQTTLQRRTTDVIRQDFAGIGDLYFRGVNVPGEFRSRELNDWSRNVPFTPLQMYEFFSAGFDHPVVLNVDVQGYSKLVVDFGLKGSKALHASFDMIVHEDTARMGLSQIKVREGFQGANLGKNSFRIMTEFTMAMQAPYYSFSAGWENGGSTWAMVGAEIDMDVRRHPGFRFTRSDLSTRLVARLDVIRDKIASEDYLKAREYCRINNKDDLVKLAEMNDVMLPMDLAPDLMDVRGHLFSRRLRKFYEPHYEAGDLELSKTVYEETRHIGHAFAYAAEKGRPGLSLFRYLTRGIYWPAIVDFANDRQMEKVGRNLGGWKFSKRADIVQPALAADLI